MRHFLRFLKIGDNDDRSMVYYFVFDLISKEGEGVGGGGGGWGGEAPEGGRTGAFPTEDTHRCYSTSIYSHCTDICEFFPERGSYIFLRRGGG